MPELKLNGKTYSGSTNYASAIEYTEDDGSKTTVQDKISELNSNLENISSNFSTAANDLGNVLVAKGYAIPTGSTVDNMIDIINNTNVVIVSSSINILTDTSITGGWTGATSMSKSGQTRTGTLLSDTKNLINLSSIKSITGTLKTVYIDSCYTDFYIRAINASGNIVKETSMRVTSSTTKNLTLDTTDISESCYIEYYVYLYRTHVDSGTGSSHVDKVYVTAMTMTP